MNLRLKLKTFFSFSKFKIQKYINKLRYNPKLTRDEDIVEYAYWSKGREVLSHIINISFTGVLIHYSITKFNWLSCGLTAWIVCYYIKWFIELVKKKEKQ